MLLKSLEIQGFKSFPDKTVLTFGEDITAIVGPNGSGKSNISDAIRWVLGEQSTKALRGGKMEDVIFGGTQLRRQTGYAEVSLVLDNTDGSLGLEETEVMITRRYYRSGDSEYYINRRSCRLKDVNELFMDTGLGREGYSIIGQGRIDEILSVRSQDRRQIFEEAAGISRFRHRKEEAEHRLERTEENLVRIDDKIAELELQVGPLKEQAEKAKKYLVLRDELRGLEISLWMEQLDRLRAGNSRLMADYAQAVRQRDEAKKQLDQLYARSEAVQEELRQRDVKAEGLRETRRQAESDRADTDSRAAVLRSRMQNNEDTLLRMKNELGDQQGREASVAAQITENTDRLGEIGGERREAKNRLAGAQAQAGTLAGELEKASAQVENLRSRAETEAAAVGDAKAALSALAAASQELLDRDTSLRAGLSELEDRLAQARQGAQDNADALAKKEQERTEEQNRVDAWKLKGDARRQRSTRLNEQVGRLRVEENTLKSRVKLLSDMEKMYEGYQKSVKAVMNEVRRGGLKGVRGPVAELLRVPDDYTVAIEIALGGAMQNIVVETEQNGKQAISWLKRRDAGRATFLPLSVIRANDLREQGVDREPGFVGIASRLISCGDEYKELFSSLLGRVVIAEDMDSAIAIADRYHHRFRIVTLDGQVLNPGGSMTGGSVSRSAGILSRANELERLQKQGETLHSDLVRAQEQLTEASREAEKCDYQLKLAQGKLREAEDAILQLQGDKNHYQLVLEDLQSRKDAAAEELNNLSGRTGQNDEEIGRARERVQTAEETAEATRQEGQQSSEDYRKLQEQAEALNSAIAEHKKDLAALDAEEETINRTLESLRSLQEDLSGDRAARLQSMEQLRQENLDLQSQLEELEEALTQLNDRLTALDEQLKAVSDEKLRLEAERTRTDQAARDKNTELLNMERETSALEQKKAAAASEENQLLDKLWDNYELTHSAAQQIRVELESVAKATRRISELKRSISALGNVNVGAVEEYDRVNGRYTYLSEQRNDVAASKAELLTIITDISKEMEVVFREQFKRIQESFTQTFLELFGGGKAELRLEDESDILNCGIEIKVQPPGKSLKIISLLSGGEKAFVAIALYFSILKVRPTPFVVMDEIEAALDDNNVVRYAQYMRSLTGNTQFIVITHRRGTMEEADVLYGVTMQEQGVSRILTINLNDVEKELHLKAN